MPSDDLVLNVRQIAGYGRTGDAPPTAALLMQLGGLGSPYASISPQDLVSTALATGGDMAIAGALAVQSVSGGSAQFSNAAINMFSAQKACIVDFAATWGTVGGVQIATVNDVSALDAALRASTVWSFNGRLGDVRLWIDDIICAGGAPIFSPRFQGSPRACTPPPESNSSRLATTAFVANAIAGAELVVSFNGRQGAVVLEAADVTALDLPYAPLDSPNFVGYATSLTPPQGTSDGQIATTAFVMNAVAESVTGVASFNGRTGLVVLSGGDLTTAGGALLASPAFTGAPTAPTAAPGTNTTQLATTAFVLAQVGGSFAPINSPVFTGTPSGPTAPVGTDTTQLATTAFVIGEINAVNAGVISFNGRTGAVSLLANDISAAGGATLLSPIFTGLPSAPTANPGTNTTQLATTQFVTAAIAALPAVPVASTTAPLMNGTAAAGSSAAYSRGDHVHPTDTSRYSASNPSSFQTAAQVTTIVNGAVANYLPLIGGTLSGNLVGTTLGLSGGINASSVATNQLSAAIVFFSNPVTDFWAQIAGNIRALAWRAGVYALQFDNSIGQLNFIMNSVAGMLLDVAGNLTITGVGSKPGGGAWADTSDARIKTVEGEWTAGLDAILALRPVSYSYRGNDTPTEHVTPEIVHVGDVRRARHASGVAPFPASPHYQAATTQKSFVGLIAQEVEAVLPDMVTRREGYIDGVKVDDLRELDTTQLIFAVVNAIKTLAARLDALEAA